MEVKDKLGDPEANSTKRLWGVEESIEMSGPEATHHHRGSARGERKRKKIRGNERVLYR